MSIEGLVETLREAADVLVSVGTMHGKDALPANWRWPLADELSGFAAILATLPEPGVVSEEAVEAACQAATATHGIAWGEVEVAHRNEVRREIRAAIEAALPYLAPAAPAGEVSDDYRRNTVANLQSARDRMMKALPGKFGDAFDGDFDTMLEAINLLKRTPKPAPAAQGLDSERLLDGVRVEHIDGVPFIRLETAKRALAAAEKGVGRG